MEFDDLNIPISKAEYKSQRPEGHRTSIDRPAWIARYKQTCDLVEMYHDNGDILEIGAYDYELTKILQSKGYGVIGVDKDTTKMADYIRKEEFDIRTCDIEREDLPFDDHSFSTVLFTEVFEHLRINPLEPLRSIRRILKPAGTLILSTPNLYYIMNVVDFVLGRGIKTMYDGYEEFKQLEEEGYPGHIRVYSKDELEKFLTNTGFEIQEVFFAEGPHEGKKRVFRPVCRMKPEMKKRIYVVATPDD
jgi:SAM-dependent methyltransferase